MRDALARDLNELPHVEFTTATDSRVPPPPFGASRPIGEDEACWAVWAEMAAEADVAWVVAPETGGALRRLVALCRDAGAKVIGPDDASIRVASSKRLTADVLAQAGMATPQTWRPDAIPETETGPFVSKPDDGAGCEGALFWPRRPPVGALPADHVVQPFAPGDALSLTVLKTNGRLSVLTANRQHVVVAEGAFAFNGLTVGALDRDTPELTSLAEAIAAALPGLDGFFGVDLVAAVEGVTVIEVNPRLTTAYAGLRDALGINPLLLLPEFGGDAPAVLPTTPVRPTEIRL